MIRLLCVEDDQMMRGCLAARLGCEPDIEMVAEVGSGAAAMAVLGREKIDVALLDFQLKGTDGVDLMRELRAWYAARPGEREPGVLFCSGLCPEEIVPRIRLLGGRGLVPKDRIVADLVPAIRAVAKGESWFGQTQEAEEWQVLVADGERATHAALEQHLPRLRCRPVFAWNCGQALEKLRETRFDALLLDHRLPGQPLVTGLLERVAEEWPELPILWLSSTSREAGVAHPHALVRGSITKPVQREPLGAALETALKGRRSAGD